MIISLIDYEGKTIHSYVADELASVRVILTILSVIPVIEKSCVKGFGMIYKLSAEIFLIVTKRKSIEKSEVPP